MGYSEYMKQIVKKLIKNNIELIEEGVLSAFLLTDGNKVTLNANDNGIIVAWKKEQDIKRKTCKQINCKWIKS